MGLLSNPTDLTASQEKHVINLWLRIYVSVMLLVGRKIKSLEKQTIQSD